MRKHYFFDLDGTITESRSKISIEVLDALKQLKGDIIIISGADKKQIRKQVGNRFTLMGQSGAEYWKFKLTRKSKKIILEHIKKIQKFFPEYVGIDLIQDRGSQISFSFIGHNADIIKKRQFDRNGVFRKSILQTIPFINDEIECRVAGTTCFDYTHKNFSKGKSIEKLIAKNNWDKSECIYFGDALFKGGNDESVIGVIDTVEVFNPQDLLGKLKNI